jgi:hypothetical protein
MKIDVSPVKNHVNQKEILNTLSYLENHDFRMFNMIILAVIRHISDDITYFLLPYTSKLKLKPSIK